VIGNYYIWVEEDYPKGLQYLEDASEIAEQVGDYLSSYFANFNLGWCLTWNCEFERALECLNRCLDLSVAANNLIGISYTKGVTSAITYGYQGRIDSAYQTNKEALEIAEESGDIFIKAMAHATYGITSVPV
jgi:tetratricopeptide (TPR) repeat protein